MEAVKAVKKTFSKVTNSQTYLNYLMLPAFWIPNSINFFLSAEELSTVYNIVWDDATALYTELSSQSLQKESNDVPVLSATQTSNDDDHYAGLVPTRKKAKQKLYEQY